MKSKERRPGFIENSSRTIKRAIGAIAFIGLVFGGAPLAGEAAVGTGLVWLGSDIAERSAKKKRLGREQH
jgi:hypothetical protein